MTEVKFHTKPTQINREDPIKIIDNGFYKAWVYPLSNGYCVGFEVMSNGMSRASSIQLLSADTIEWLYHTTMDIHTRQDLVNFVKEWDKMTVFDIVDLQESILKMDLYNTQSLHTL